MNFSSRHTNYFSAWKYTTKEDRNYVESLNHPKLAEQMEPKKGRVSSPPAHKRKQNKREKHLCVYEVSEIVVTGKIKSRFELVALANELRQKGDVASAKLTKGVRQWKRPFQSGGNLKRLETCWKEKQ